MRLILLVGASASALFATPAFAQDEQTSGAHILAVGGFDSVDVDGNSEDIFYGLNAGYDYVFGGLFMGIEAEGTLSGVGETFTDVIDFNDKLEIEAGRDLYAGVRVGTAPSENIKVYLKAGYTNAAIDFAYVDTAGIRMAKSESLGGYRVGAGIDFGFGPPAVMRLEYRYSDYGETELFGLPTDIVTSRHQIAMGVGAKF